MPSTAQDTIQRNGQQAVYSRPRLSPHSQGGHLHRTGVLLVRQTRRGQHHRHGEALLELRSARELHEPRFRGDPPGALSRSITPRSRGQQPSQGSGCQRKGGASMPPRKMLAQRKTPRYTVGETPPPPLCGLRCWRIGMVFPDCVPRLRSRGPRYCACQVSPVLPLTRRNWRAPSFCSRRY